MIELITGLPGNGKTLYTIGHVKTWSEKDGRPVFYHGIPELTLPWTLLDDPTKWMDVPKGAIVVLDEAQKTFRNRSVGQIPPKHVTDLETHRHLGIDLVMITQHPSLIDPSVRRLAGRHQHMIRIWGTEASTVHKWDAVRDNCDKPAGRKDSEKRKWVFDKTLYGLYKSAEVHTMKRSIPMRVKLLVASLPVLGLAIAAAVYSVRQASPGDPVKSSVAKSAPAGQQYVSQNTNTSPSKRPADPVDEVRDWQWKETPRVAQLPQTAPKYDALTVPSRVPIPAMCIQKGSVGRSKEVTCKCYSQQATPMNVEFNMCMSFARNGFFQDFDADKDRQASQRTDAGVAALSGRPDSAIPVRQESPPGVVIPGLPSGPGRTDKSGPMVVEGVIQDGPPNNRATRAVSVAGV